MKKIFNQRKNLNLLFISVFFLISFLTTAQVFKTFSPRFNKKTEGDMTMIANSIVNRGDYQEKDKWGWWPWQWDWKYYYAKNPYNAPYSSTEKNYANDDFSMVYIDNDNDGSTFSSSSATLSLPDPNKSKIIYAGLYWSATYRYDKGTGSGNYTRQSFDKVKLKVPGGSYVDIKGEILYDTYRVSSMNDASPYACYADITKYVTALRNPSGEYFVANIRVTQGKLPGGVSGGWNIFFVYENPDLPNRYITSFDGFAAVSSSIRYTDIQFSGFKTVSYGTVRGKLAAAALEGDQNISGDRLQFKAGKRSSFTDLGSSLRPKDNFFNSRITLLGTEYTNRNLSSRNTLGYDADITDITGLMDTGETRATLRLYSTQDQYYMFFSAFNVEVMEPRIYVVKTLEGPGQKPIESVKIKPKDDIYYKFTFWNKGNDDADEFVIEDKLPANIRFWDHVNNFYLPPGVKYTYNKNTHTLKFTVPNKLVKKGGAKYTIIVRVYVTDCDTFKDACSHKISNQAIYRYRGDINKESILNQKSFSDFNNLTTPSPTDIKVDIEDCSFKYEAEICKGSVLLEAGKGYTSYIWRDSKGKEVGRNKTYTATIPDVYTVTCQAPPGCEGIKMEFRVKNYSGSLTENPLKPFADEIVQCSNNGLWLTKFFLCGVNDERRVTLKVSGASSIAWEKLNESSCTAQSQPTCPNTNLKCKWNNVSKGGNFTVNKEGQYRLKIVYKGGCETLYYFNVYRNELKFDIRSTDIICDKPGKIEVTGLPGTGYEFALRKDGPYQSSPSFTVTAALKYTVFIRQKGAGNKGCIFEKSAVVSKREITIDIKNAEVSCSNSAMGTIRVQVNGGYPQYNYKLYKKEKGGWVFWRGDVTLNENDYSFTYLLEGTYKVIVTSDRGVCKVEKEVDVVIPKPLKVKSDVLPISCEDGKITLKVTGGTQPYYYKVNGGEKLMDPVIPITTPGTYTIDIEDAKGCTISTQLTVEKLDEPTYKIVSTDAKCSSNDGRIDITEIDPKGYRLGYSINGEDYQYSPLFSNLSGGTYTLTVRYAYQDSESGEDRIFCEKRHDIILKGMVPVNASIVVIEDIACDPQNRAKVRIINPVGGKAPYTYSINGSAFTTNAEGYIPAGTINAPAEVKDSNGCVFNMKITIDPVPVVPDITTSYEYFCNGEATITVNTTILGYDYNYALESQNGKIIGPQPSNIFKNIAPGNYKLISKYESPNDIGFNILLKDDFGQGKDVPIPEIKGYKFIDQDIYLNHQIDDGEYTVTKRLKSPAGTWIQNLRDHTGNTDGRMLIVNVGGREGKDNLIYEKEIKDIKPGQDLNITLWGLNLFKKSHSGGADPNITIELVSITDNKVIATKNTGNIRRTGDWNLISLELNPGNNDHLYLRIRTMSLATNGNDLGIDDIQVGQRIVKCDYKQEQVVIIEGGKSFKANLVSTTDISCNGSADGKAVIQVDGFFTPYQYNLDNSNSWIDVSLDADFRFMVDGLGSGEHTILVKSSVGSTSPCQDKIELTISEPKALQLSVKEQSFVDCNVVQVTLEAKGGSGEDVFVLELPDGNVLPGQKSPVFKGLTVEGTYKATVKDKKGCSKEITFDLIESIPVVAVIDAGSDLCYTDAKRAMIVLSITGGQSPYQYSLDNGTTWSSTVLSPRFEIKDLLPGTYNFLVRDHLGCTTTVSQEISQQLISSASLKKGPDCTATPEAVITLNVKGGTAPIKYQVYKGGVIQGSSVELTGTTADYTAKDAGKYSFEITDSNGCSVKTQGVVVVPLVPVSFNAEPGPKIACHGSETGEVIIKNVAGGLAPYKAEIYNTDTGTSYGERTTGLPAGNYTVTFTDANNCNESKKVEIKQNDPIAFDTEKENIVCRVSRANQSIKGKITVKNVTGGESPYIYMLRDHKNEIKEQISAHGEDHTFDILEFGIYSVEVIDSNKCSKIVSEIKIASPPGELKIEVYPADSDCTVSGKAKVTANGELLGEGPFFFAVYREGMPDYPDSAYIPSDSPDGLSATFKDLIPGVTYSFIVYDQSTYCYHYETADKPIPTISTLISTVNPKNVSCKGAKDGKVSFTFDKYKSGTTKVSYEIHYALSNLSTGIKGSKKVSGGEAGVDDVGPLNPGKYYILFKEVSSGCTQVSAVFNISESATELTISAAVIKNANCNAKGSIGVNGHGGAHKYQYFIQDNVSGITAPDAEDPAWQSSSVFKVKAGNYTVYAKDANSCIKSTTITMIEDPLPEIKAQVIDACAGQGNYNIKVERIDITGGVGPYWYSLNGNAFVTQADGFTYTNLNSGSYKIVIKDGNGCTFETAVPIHTPLELAIDSMSQPTCNTKDGIIKVIGSGGSGNYEYRLQDESGKDIGDPQAVNEFTGLAAGNYIVVIRDIDTKCKNKLSFTLDMPSPVSFGLLSTAVSCFGGDDGKITVTLDATNINSPYKYSLDKGITWQNEPIFENLKTGTYTVTVKSERGCEAQKGIEVIEADLIKIAKEEVHQFGCTTANQTNYALITVNPLDVTGGSGKYTFVLTNASGDVISALNPTVEPKVPVSWRITDMAGGTYTFTVSDSNGCTMVKNIDIEPYYVLTNVSVEVQESISCVNMGESVEIKVMTSESSDKPANPKDFEYSKDNGENWQGSNVFKDLGIGIHYISIRNKATGCRLDISHQVKDPNDIKFVFRKLNDVDCFGTETGKITFSISSQNYSGTFDWSIYKNGGSTAEKTGVYTSGSSDPEVNLAVGNYKLVVIQQYLPKCLKEEIFDILEPETALTLTLAEISNVSCDEDKGIISAKAEGGWEAYQYKLDGPMTVDFSSNFVFTDLVPGKYTVFVKDLKGCEVSQTIELKVPIPISATITANKTELSCHGDNDAVITVEATGGSGNYLYTLRYNEGDTPPLGPQADKKFSNLSAGNYYVTITDSWNCKGKTNIIEIKEPEIVSASIRVAQGATCTKPAQIEIVVKGGTAPYEYSDDNINFKPLPSESIDAAVGTHSYYIRDSKKCSGTNVSITIDPVPELTVTLELLNAAIGCDPTHPEGKIEANVEGGLGEYKYQLLDESGKEIGQLQDTGLFKDLAAGTYSVKVISVDCEAVSEEQVTIADYAPMQVDLEQENLSCNEDGSVGKATVHAEGGSGEYLYAISPNLAQFDSKNTFDGLAPGEYTIIVQDKNASCYEPIEFTIIEPEKIVVEELTVTQELCKGDGKGSIKFNINGGTAPYFTSIDGDSFIENRFEFTNLEGGKEYKIYIKDAKGCFGPTVSETLEASVNLQPKVEQRPRCNDNNIPVSVVIVSVNPEIESSKVTYALDDIDSTYGSDNTFIGLTEGEHEIFVEYTNGCIQSTGKFIVEALQPITMEVPPTVENIKCGGTATGTITVHASGGTGVLEYAISTNPNDFQTNPEFTVKAGTYTVYVRDEIGCIIYHDKVKVTEIPAAEITVKDKHTESCHGDEDGYITITIDKGTAPYTTSIDGVNFLPNHLYFENLKGGVTYTIYVKDKNNCVTEHPVDLPPSIDLNPIATVTYNCNKNNNSSNQVEISINPEAKDDVLYSLYMLLDGGKEQEIGNSQFSNIFSNLSPGKYIVKVDHIDGCEKETKPFEIVSVSPLELKLGVKGLNQIVATVSGGVSPYHYYFNDHDNGNRNDYRIKETGTYTVKVVDAAGCEIIDEIYEKFIDIHIPNFFTPNHDGHNDTWGPENTQNYSAIKIRIYDRNGREVKVLKSRERWNGRYKGVRLPSGDYWYTIKLNGDSDTRQFIGNVTIYR